MQPGYIMRALWRRKFLSAIGLVLTVVLAGGAAVAVGPSYSTQAIVLLVPPIPSPGVKNPYLYLAGLSQARDIVQRSLSSDEVQADLKKAGATADYTVTDDPMSSGPLLIITTDAPTEEQTTRTMTALLKDVGPATTRLQNRLSIAASAQIKTLEITRDQKPRVVRKGQMRIGILATAAGLGMSLLVIALVDGLLMRRRRGDERGSESVPAAGGPPDLRGDPTGRTAAAGGQSPRRRPAPTPAAPPDAPTAEPSRAPRPPGGAGPRPGAHPGQQPRAKMGPAAHGTPKPVRGEVRK